MPGIVAAGAVHTLKNVLVQYTVRFPLPPPKGTGGEALEKMPAEAIHYQSVRSRSAEQRAPRAHMLLRTTFICASVLHHTTLHYTTLHHIALHYATMLRITLHCTTLHYTTLHYTTLHYTALHPLH